MVDLSVIKQRKSVYGDNFSEIAKMWSKIMSVQEHAKDDVMYFTPASVALYMADLKRVRIAHIDKELAKFPLPDRGIELYASRDDSIVDRDNYMWIAENFEEYMEL